MEPKSSPPGLPGRGLLSCSAHILLFVFSRLMSLLFALWNPVGVALQMSCLGWVCTHVFESNCFQIVRTKKHCQTYMLHHDPMFIYDIYTKRYTLPLAMMYSIFHCIPFYTNNLLLSVLWKACARPVLRWKGAQPQSFEKCFCLFSSRKGPVMTSKDFLIPMVTLISVDAIPKLS